ncbi:hypothetical protein WBG78_04905 [Chryseolinea sp. T2]|uniref:hypothetical protein n=1 Tax=Chryseolinea sp. T2 TaxID=3129255 RepID=UPI00307697E7
MIQPKAFAAMFVTPQRCRRALTVVPVLALLLMCFATIAQATQLMVCRVDGRVAYNGMPVHVGSEIAYSDDLVLDFSSTQDILVVVSPEKGRYMISARNSTVVNGVVKVRVRENFVPCPTLRDGERISAETDIHDLLRDGRFSILDSVSLPLGAAYLDNQTDQYFFVSYQYNGRKLAQRIAVSASQPYLTLSTSLFRSYDELIDPANAQQIELYFHDAGKNLSEKITDLKITSLLSESTIAELRVLVNGIRAYTNDDEALTFQEVKSHIEEFYGQISNATLQNYLRMMAVR